MFKKLFSSLFDSNDGPINYFEIEIFTSALHPSESNMSKNAIPDKGKYSYKDENFPVLHKYFRVRKSKYSAIEIKQVRYTGDTFPQFREKALKMTVQKCLHYNVQEESQSLSDVKKILWPENFTAGLFTPKVLEHLKKELNLDQINWLRIDHKSLYLFQDNVSKESKKSLKHIADETKNANPAQFFSSKTYQLSDNKVVEMGDIDGMPPVPKQTKKKDEAEEKKVNINKDFLPRCRNKASISEDGGMIEIEGKLYPMPTGSLSYVGQRIDDHAVIYSVDLDTHFIYLNQDQVKKIDQSKEEILTIAGNNFYKLFSEKMKSGPLNESQTIFACQLDHNHEASISLYPDLIKFLGETHGLKNIGWAVPVTNVFLFWDEKNQKSIVKEVVTMCTEYWQNARPKDRVSVISMNIDFEKGHMKHGFLVIPDAQLEDIYLPKNSDVKIGQYLLAKTAHEGSPFEKSVIFIFDKVDKWTYGVIINTTEGELLNKTLDIGDSEFLLTHGGPAQKGELFCMHTMSDLKSAKQIVDGLYLNGDFGRVKDMLSNKTIGHGQIRFFDGKAVWSNDQLTAELRMDGWDVVDAEIIEFMHTPEEKLWEILSAKANMDKDPTVLVAGKRIKKAKNSPF